MSRPCREAECKFVGGVIVQLRCAGHVFWLWASRKAGWKGNSSLARREKNHQFLWEANISQRLTPLWGCTDNRNCGQQWPLQHHSKLRSGLLIFPFLGLWLPESGVNGSPPPWVNVVQRHSFLWLSRLCFGMRRTDFTREPKDTCVLKETPKRVHSASCCVGEDLRKTGCILFPAWIFPGSQEPWLGESSSNEWHGGWARPKLASMCENGHFGKGRGKVVDLSGGVVKNLTHWLRSSPLCHEKRSDGFARWSPHISLE